jgi:hypothetical protein
VVTECPNPPSAVRLLVEADTVGIGSAGTVPPAGAVSTARTAPLATAAAVIVAAAGFSPTPAPSLGVPHTFGDARRECTCGSEGRHAVGLGLGLGAAVLVVVRDVMP